MHYLSYSRVKERFVLVEQLVNVNLCNHHKQCFSTFSTFYTFNTSNNMFVEVNVSYRTIGLGGKIICKQTTSIYLPIHKAGKYYIYYYTVILSHNTWAALVFVLMLVYDLVESFCNSSPNYRCNRFTTGGVTLHEKILCI